MQRTSDQASDTKRWGAGALVFAALAVVGGMSNAYVISLLTIVLLFTFMGQSWNLMLGIGGQLSIGHALFVGIGAYAVAILNIKYGVTPWIGLLLGAVIAGFVGAVLAWLPLRGPWHLFRAAHDRSRRIRPDHVRRVGLCRRHAGPVLSGAERHDGPRDAAR